MVLIRNSISNTRSFFLKAMKSFKSLLSKTGPYERLSQKTGEFAAKQGVGIYTEKKGGSGERRDGVVKLDDRETRVCLVGLKLKELEKMDMGNVEHRLDVEEALLYYSKLTSPLYLDIVDNFMNLICDEIFQSK